MPPIIEARGISKLFKLGISTARKDSFRELILRTVKSPLSFLRQRGFHGKTADGRSDELWALRDVNFDIEAGDIVGIIGRNGAGKSTLLKILSRITEPTAGYIAIRGRLSSLLEVGTGFHQELTGRENIFMNGAILGMRKAEIVSRFDEIVAFAEIERFLDTPVKRYSSGMYVRLAFAVAAHLNPEILVVDEVLAVGDLAFQRKCLGKMTEVSHCGRTILFVSHNMAAVESMCESGLVLEQGRLKFSGNITEAIAFYIHNLSDNTHGNSVHVVDLSKAPSRSSKYHPLLRRIELSTSDGKPLGGGIPIGAPLTLRVSFNLEIPTLNCDVILGFDSLLGQRMFTASTKYEPNIVLEARVGDQDMVCEIPSVTMLPGEYRIKAILSIASTHVDVVEDAARITIVPSDYYGTGKIPQNGLFVLKHTWKRG